MNNYQAKSIRAFIGAKNYTNSRNFYRDLGFEELELDPTMCYFKVNEELGFYLQDMYVKGWINNSMIFLEVEQLDVFEKELLQKELTSKYKGVKISEIKVWDWGRVIFMHDPSGVLWQFGQFHSREK